MDIVSTDSNWHDAENNERCTCKELHCSAVTAMEKLKLILDTALQNERSHELLNTVDKQARDEHYVTEIMQVMTELKYYSRLVKHKVNTSKELMFKKQREVHKLSTLHQNLLKEKDYLQNEVEKCLEFNSEAQNRELLPVEEFLKNAPAELTEEKNEDRLYMNRLRWELNDRLRLVKDLEELKLQKVKLKKQIKMFRNYFKSFDVDKLMEAASPLQSKLGLSLNVTAVEQKIPDYLPLPLYYLYSQIATYAESDKDLEYSIQGDIEAAKAFQMKSEYDIITKNTVKYDCETEDIQSSDPVYDVKVTYGAKNILAMYPLFVQVLITEGDIQVILKFAFLYHLNIATVNVEVSRPNISSIHSEVFVSEEFLNCLFPNDNGLQAPRTAISILLLQHGYTGNNNIFSNDTVGLPYHWVQKLTGLHFFLDEELSEGCTISTAPERTLFVEQTLLAIRQRINTKVALHKQLISLANKTLPETPVNHLCPSNIISEIESWSIVSWKEIESHPNYQQMLEDDRIQPSMSTVYKACIKRCAIEFIAYVILHLDYPVTWPLFLLNFSSNGQWTCAKSVELEGVDEEINTKCLKHLPKEHHIYMLTWQFHHLLSTSLTD